MLMYKHQGITLIDVIIGSSIGLLVLAGMILFLSNISNYSTKTLKEVRLHSELQMTLDLMAHDIRRAGYWANASNMIATGVNSNPFMASSTDLSLPSSSCILFSYDLDKNGLMPSLGAAGSDERFGYRLSNGIVQARAVTDGTLDCGTGSWENLTSPNVIEVTNLTFTRATGSTSLNPSPATDALESRYVTVAITGRLVDDTTVTKTLSTNIRVRNDKFKP